MLTDVQIKKIEQNIENQAAIPKRGLQYEKAKAEMNLNQPTIQKRIDAEKAFNQQTIQKKAEPGKMPEMQPNTKEMPVHSPIVQSPGIQKDMKKRKMMIAGVIAFLIISFLFVVVIRQR